MTNEQKAKITEMRTSGASYAVIASAVSLSVGTVKAFCSRHITEPKEDGCKRCGGEIINTPGHRQRVFCSAECQKLYWREHPEQMKHKATVNHICPSCGKSFIDYAGHHRKFCSHACYIAYRYGGAVNESERNQLSDHNDVVQENGEIRDSDTGGIRRN